MTGPQFKQALERIGVSQRRFAKLNGVNERTVRNWIKHGPPVLVANYVEALTINGRETEKAADCFSGNNAANR